MSDTATAELRDLVAAASPATDITVEIELDDQPAGQSLLHADRSWKSWITPSGGGPLAAGTMKHGRTLDSLHAALSTTRPGDHVAVVALASAVRQWTTQ